MYKANSLLSVACCLLPLSCGAPAERPAGRAERPAPTLKERPTAAPPTPVVVELFTSEGCSSCPPADEVLRRLDEEQPIPGAEIVALGLHVDYWDYIGWADPFSSPAFGARQGEYAEALGAGSYTPQMVVDGRVELLGSDAARAREAIAAAALTPKAALSLSLLPPPKGGEGDMIALEVAVEAPPEGAELFLAITERGLSSEVKRGENAGRRLTHCPVVRALLPMGPLEAGRAAKAITLARGWRRENLRAVAFLQDKKTRRILGAAALPLAPPPS
jgi:hypothetical protein